MKKTNTTKTAAKVLISCEGKFLLLRRSRLVTSPGRWDLAGGSLDPGETILQGLIREINEEIGFEIDENRARLLASWQGKNDGKTRIINKNCFLYQADQELKPKLSWEHSEFKWMSLMRLWPRIYRSSTKNVCRK